MVGIRRRVFLILIEYALACLLACFGYSLLLRWSSQSQRLSQRLLFIVAASIVNCEPYSFESYIARLSLKARSTIP
jgi:hypothetical protein